jgi:hypothetical protein
MRRIGALIPTSYYGGGDVPGAINAQSKSGRWDKTGKKAKKKE